MQVGGASLFLSNNINLSQTGLNILLAGLALQVPSFGLFMVSVIVFDVRTRKQLPKAVRKQWEPLLYALYFASLMILVSRPLDGQLPV